MSSGLTNRCRLLMATVRKTRRRRRRRRRCLICLNPLTPSTPEDQNLSPPDQVQRHLAC